MRLHFSASGVAGLKTFASQKKKAPGTPQFAGKAALGMYHHHLGGNRRPIACGVSTGALLPGALTLSPSPIPLQIDHEITASG